VVNRDRAQAIQTTVQLADAHVTHGIAYVVDGPSPNAVNSFEQPKQVDIQRRSLNVGGASFEHTFPAHSVSVLRLGVGLKE
jgi:alpha-L-arabinofuranosidase